MQGDAEKKMCTVNKKLNVNIICKRLYKKRNEANKDKKKKN